VTSAGTAGASMTTRDERLSTGGWRAALGRATTVTLRRPALWSIALAGFLARGGFLVFLLAILPVPTAVGLANAIGPTAVTASGLTPESILVLVGLGLGVIVWFVLGGVIGAAADIAIVEGSVEGSGDAPRDATADAPGDAQPLGPTSLGRLIPRLLGIRIVALIPLAIAIAISARAIFDALYAELTAPSTVAAPLEVRVLSDAAGPVAVVCLGWFIGEVLGGIAVRFAIGADRSIGWSIVGALVQVVRHPVGTVATVVVGSAGFLLAIGPAVVASAIASSALRDLIPGGTPVFVTLAAVVIVAIWFGALLLTGVGAAWRSLLWSAEIDRAQGLRRPVQGRDVRASE
jgi:hypothetical protein